MIHLCAKVKFLFLGYDMVEWLAVQDWSSGKVGMYGASAFAMAQWLVAAEQPPSLAVCFQP